MFDTVGSYIKDARVLLQDCIPPLRYSTASLTAALNVTLLRGRELRPDIFATTLDSTPQYYIDENEDALLDNDPFPTDVPNTSTLYDAWVPIEEQFRPAFVYGLIGHALMRDQEDIEDARANSFVRMFEKMLLGTAVTPALVPQQGA